jgi:hypothetical protein
MGYTSKAYPLTKGNRNKITWLAARLMIILLGLSLSSCVIPSEYIPDSLRDETTPAAKRRPARKTAISLDDRMKHHKESSVCCASFKEFNFDKLIENDSINFNIDKESKASTFHGGKSWFASFELPEYGTPYTISIKSYLIGENLNNGYVFSPQIIFLNKDYHIAKTIPCSLFEYTGDVPENSLAPEARLEANLDIGHGQRDYRYMIILTPAKILGTRQAYSPTKKAPAAITGKKVSINHSPAGELKIDLSSHGN